MAASQAEHQPVVQHGGATGILLLLCPLPDFSLKIRPSIYISSCFLHLLNSAYVLVHRSSLRFLLLGSHIPSKLKFLFRHFSVRIRFRFYVLQILFFLFILCIL
jgi:hypothetical protein